MVRRISIFALLFVASFIIVMSPIASMDAPSWKLAANTTGTSSQTCSSSGFTLNWILCPVFTLIGNAAQAIFSVVIEPELVEPPIPLTPVNNHQQPNTTYIIWSNFRVYGDIVLVLAILVIVYGEAIGGGVVDAYNVRKMLPRVLIAAILINLSIYIVALMVDITNVIGSGVGDFITAPFHAYQNVQFTGPQQVGAVFDIGIIGLLGTVGFLATLVTAIFSPVLFGQAAIALLLLVVIPIFIAILSTFVVLVIRQGLILLLVLISPVAFALYCLPNTEKYFKKWWDLLIKTLMVYPIIIIIFAISDVLSISMLKAGALDPTDHNLIVIGSNLGANGLTVLVAVFLQFIPLFLIPFAFKFSGSALGNMHGVLNGGMKRLHGSTTHKLGMRQTHKMWQGLKDKSYEGSYSGNNKRLMNGNSSFNKIVRGISRPDSFIPGKLGSNGRSSLTTSTISSANTGAKKLQDLGLLDDVANTEFIAHYEDVDSHIKTLQSQANIADAAGDPYQGQHYRDLASKLVGYSQFSGQRNMALGAMKLNASYGKLSDSSLEKLGTMFDYSSPVEASAQKAIFGDLTFASKTAGNYVTAGAALQAGKVLTMHNDTEATKERMSKLLLDTGPQQLSNIKVFVDKTSAGKVIYDTRVATAEAIVSGVDTDSIKTNVEAKRSIENLVMQRTVGSYNTPAVKIELDKAWQAKKDIPLPSPYSNGVKMVNTYGDLYSEVEQSMRRLNQDDINSMGKS